MNNTQHAHVADSSAFSEIITITPSMAERMLALNTKNRPISRKHVEMLAGEIHSARWRFNGDPIRFADGKLIDGQHRLTALVEAGVALQFLVVHNLQPEVFDTIDSGKTRSASDVLAINGENNAPRLAATLRFVHAYEAKSLGDNLKLSATEVEATLNRHPEIRKSVDMVAALAVRPFIPFTVLAGCHYLFSKKDAAMADKVISQVITGEELPAGGPLAQFRARAMQLSLKSARVPSYYVAALLVKAWNQLRKGEAKTLSFRATGKTPEVFPLAA